MAASMNSIEFVRGQILQLAACAADTLARDRATVATKALRDDEWCAAVDTIAGNLALPALTALSHIESVADAAGLSVPSAAAALSDGELI